MWSNLLQFNVDGKCTNSKKTPIAPKFLLITIQIETDILNREMTSPKCFRFVLLCFGLLLFCFLICLYCDIEKFGKFIAHYLHFIFVAIRACNLRMTPLLFLACKYIESGRNPSEFHTIFGISQL